MPKISINISDYNYWNFFGFCVLFFFVFLLALKDYWKGSQDEKKE